MDSKVPISTQVWNPPKRLWNQTTGVLNPCSDSHESQASNLNYVFFFLNKFIYLFICFWVFVAARGLSLVAVSASLQCSGFSLQWLLLLRSAALGTWASVVVAHGLSCSAACGIFPDQGLNPCPLQWQADS